MSSKFPEQSKTIQTDIVLPGDTNSLNNLFGGELLARMDKVASIAAIKHSEQIVVTASINNVAFGEPVPQSELEKKRYEAALRRRQLSLVLAGKMKPSEATELKAIFD